ncbi:MAG: hypothetical protein COX02_00725 [Candidatus Vogelbacteria bacterium CG22_combo_CG10-13_8_21_14_all_37_9]|uniref:Primosomal protein N' 3' DNA-binding domain-containing protein n=1 Tax=Candidatus Vogelbacteria bacterium CG22_combo_CG10-13_8_21_14_all_37_9 TaxID=1975046 RepID=A0A2H0BL08_9BACT|nr:MAG: hypothetical protein BK005_02350 [bacterium CG10_37_50]PIP58366.1 MAG: hypothetical protein COX02_00725 [Candidatus Vogelbacteria bacterium CG22_combo_CG10-13_8_21_14_all_37_9]
MKIVTVVPLEKGFFKENLSYFSAKELKPGAVVSIPLRQKTVEALVIEVEDLSVLKTELKKSDFSLKKIGAVKSAGFFKPEFISAAEETANYQITSLGSVIRSFTPSTILKGISKLKPLSPSKEITIIDQQIKLEKFILQEPDDDRFALYKKIIRENFAQKQSVFLLTPTNADAHHLFELLTRGIENYTILLTSDTPEKDQLKNWKQALQNPHPLLIIGTPLFLSLPRLDLKTIIVERENATAYKQLTRPYIDARLFAERLAKHSRAKLILGDIILRTETIWRKDQGEFIPLSPSTYRSFSSAQKQILVPTKQLAGEQKIFDQAIGPELKTLIEKIITQGENLFIFSGRRGLNPLTICSDCGQILDCPKCHIPLNLHQGETSKKNPNHFWLCHKCGHNQTANDNCPTCSGHRLILMGFGAEKVEAELNILFPNTKIWRLDSDHKRLAKKTEEIINTFYQSPGAILIGTELALFHLREKIDNVAVVSIDAYFTIPEFRINEKIFNILLRLRQLTLKNFMIQTREASEKILAFALKGNIADFQRQELVERKKLKYPPFSTLIKISVRANNHNLTQALETLKDEHLTKYQTIIYDSVNNLGTGADTWTNLLLRLPAGAWPESNLLILLRQLSPAFFINVDPDNIF